MGITVDVIMSNDLYDSVASNVKTTKVIPPNGMCTYGFSHSERVPVGIDDMVSMVILAAGEKNKISALRIWSHGVTTLVYADGGTSDNPDGSLVLGVNYLNAGTISNFENSLHRLAFYFDKFGRIELRGCAPAKGTGKDMMLRLAKICGVDVYGSSISQSGITWGSGVQKATPGGVFMNIEHPLEAY